MKVNNVWLGFPAMHSQRGLLTRDKLWVLCSRQCAAWGLGYVSWGVGLSRPQPCGMRLRCWLLDMWVGCCALWYDMLLYYWQCVCFLFMVGPVLMAVCASGLRYGLWLGRPWHVYALWLVILCFTYYVFHTLFLWYDGLLLLVALCVS